MHSVDIPIINLLFGSIILVLPILIFQYYKTGLTKDMLISFGRMSVQLAFVGFYMSYIFTLNNVYINFAWVSIMIMAAGISIIRRSGLKGRFYAIPVITGVIVDVLINVFTYTFLIMSYKEFFDARYMIPILGMVIGNCITNSIIGIKTFYSNIKKDENRYKYMLVAGFTRDEALKPFISDALKLSFAPTIASNATIGLIWLPGMMTGQILGGSDPMTAIKYQLLIVASIFVGSVATVFISLNLLKKYTFDEYDNLVSQ